MSPSGVVPAESVAQRFSHSLLRHLRSEHWLSLEACLGCRQCGTACAWHLQTGDWQHHPFVRKDRLRSQIRRLATWRGRLGHRLRIAAPPSEAELRSQMESYWKCALCGRCTLACPLGLSNVGLFRLVRTAFAECGLSAENPTRRAIIENTRRLGHSFGMTAQRSLVRLGFHLSVEETDVPLDRQRADYLLVIPTVDAVQFPEHLHRLFQVLNAADLDYTLSSRVTDLGTEIAHTIVDGELSVQMLHRVEAEAKRLGAKALLIPECGCDVRTFFVDAPHWLGRAFSVPIRSVDSVLLESIRSGRLPVARLPTTVTLHDPCQVTRLAGMGQLIRELLREIAPHFREMQPNGVQNYCCNGSSGLLRLPENTEIRRRVSALKARQIERTQAEEIVAPCAVCTISLNDICQFYDLATPRQRKARMLYELVHEAAALAARGHATEDRLRSPVSLRRQKLHRSSTLRGWLEDLRLDPIYPEHVAHLSSDETVSRVLNGNLRAQQVLDAMAPGQLANDLSQRCPNEEAP